MITSDRCTVLYTVQYTVLYLKVHSWAITITGQLCSVALPRIYPGTPQHLYYSLNKKQWKSNTSDMWLCLAEESQIFIFSYHLWKLLFLQNKKSDKKDFFFILYLGEFLLNPCGQGCPCQRLTFLQCSGRERLSIRQDRLVGQCLQRRIYTEEKAKVICASYFAPGRLEE